LEELDRILQQLQIRRIANARPVLWMAEQTDGAECANEEEHR
jgi:hypothetical protein